MTQTSQPQEAPQGKHYDEQIETFADTISDTEYAEVIVNGGARVELYSLGVTLGKAVGVSLELTPRQARALAQRLLAAADIAEDNDGDDH